MPAPAPIEGSQILLGEAAEALADENGRIVALYQRAEGEVLIPFTELARLLGWVTTPDEGNPDGYTVAANGYMLHVAYSRDESGQVMRVDIQVDALPAELLPEQVLVAGEELLLTPAALETLLHAQWSFSPEVPAITMIFPPKDAPGSDAAGG